MTWNQDDISSPSKIDELQYTIHKGNILRGIRRGQPNLNDALTLTAWRMMKVHYLQMVNAAHKPLPHLFVTFLAGVDHQHAYITGRLSGHPSV